MFFVSNPLATYFMAAKRTAANVPQPGEAGDYSAEMFAADFPQFYDSGGNPLCPESMLEQFITQANDSILPSRWGTMWRYAAGLYVAHFATLYLKTYAESNNTPAGAVSGAEQAGLVKHVQMGDTSIDYDNTATTAATAEWGMWNATTYGQQLASMMRQVGMGGMYAI